MNRLSKSCYFRLFDVFLASKGSLRSEGILIWADVQQNLQLDMQPARTHINLHIRTVWAESLLITCDLQSPVYPKRDKWETCHTGWMYRLTSFFAVHTSLIKVFVVRLFIHYYNVPFCFSNKGLQMYLALLDVGCLICLILQNCSPDLLLSDVWATRFFWHTAISHLLGFHVLILLLAHLELAPGQLMQWPVVRRPSVVSFSHFRHLLQNHKFDWAET